MRLCVSSLPWASDCTWRFLSPGADTKPDPRLPVAKERVPLVATVNDIMQHAKIFDSQLPKHGFTVKVTTPWLSIEYYNLVH